MVRRVEPVHRGQALSATRQNRLIDAVNTLGAGQPGSALADPGFLAHPTLALEVKALGSSSLTCVLPGESGNASAREWTVELPDLYVETSRGAVSYVYSDINTRTASDGGTNPDETQHLTPPLTVGEVIQARDENGAAWRMLGDGRMWAIDPP